MDINWLIISPEIFVTSMALVVLLADVYFSDRVKHLAYWLTQLSLIGAFGITVFTMTGTTEHLFSGTFVRDGFADLMKLATFVVAFAVFSYSRSYLMDRDFYSGEYFSLGLLSVLGMMVMISAHNLVTIYLGLEIMSLALYALVAMHRENARASESAMKYFVLGALATGMLLYGMSMLYGSTGTLDLVEMSRLFASDDTRDLVLGFGLVFIIIGLAFKLGAVPFHMWVPDVYHGAPTAVTLMIASAPKIAAFAMVYRLLWDGLMAGVDVWRDLLIVLAVLSLVVGSIVALAQTNLKRLLAYSTISHVGFLLLGVVAADANGFASAMFYVVVYALTAAAGFGIILLMASRGYEADTLDDLRGLSERSPWFALMMLIVVFSMAGVPPTVGFYAKLSVLNAAVSAGYTWLAIVAVVMAIISLFYYLRIIKMMYFDDSQERPAVNDTLDMKVVLSVNSLALLGLGILPGGLMALCIAAVV